MEAVSTAGTANAVVVVVRYNIHSIPHRLPTKDFLSRSWACAALMLRWCPLGWRKINKLYTIHYTCSAKLRGRLLQSHSADISETEDRVLYRGGTIRRENGRFHNPRSISRDITRFSHRTFVLLLFDCITAKKRLVAIIRRPGALLFM